MLLNMPIEIKELHIKATVVDKKLNSVPAQMQAHEKEMLKKEIIRSCVQEVLQVLEDKTER